MRRRWRQAQAAREERDDEPALRRGRRHRRDSVELGAAVPGQEARDRQGRPLLPQPPGSKTN